VINKTVRSRRIKYQSVVVVLGGHQQIHLSLFRAKCKKIGTRIAQAKIIKNVLK